MYIDEKRAFITPVEQERISPERRLLYDAIDMLDHVGWCRDRDEMIVLGQTVGFCMSGAIQLAQNFNREADVRKVIAAVVSIIKPQGYTSIPIYNDARGMNAAKAIDTMYEAAPLL
jgi:hypothetical protein